MSQQLISRNPDLQKLQSEGFDLEIRDGQIYVHHVPFLNSKQEISDGTLAFTYSSQGDIVAPPTDHTAHWIGSKPFTVTGQEVPSLINSQVNGWNGHNEVFFLSLFRDGQKGKPYSDFYEKATFYFKTIAGHAFQKDKIKAEKIRQMITAATEEDVFNYQDTNSARAGIIGLANKMKGKKVAIVGLGGTGSYLLDLVAKTPVAEIHLFDDDIFSTHNAFRAPGASTLNELKQGLSKVEYFSMKYSAMHRHVIPHMEKIMEGTISNLFDMDIVFLCVDSVKARNFIARHLADKNIPFIDSGLGMAIRNNAGLAGQIRCTTFDGTHGDHLSKSFGKEEIEDDGVYNTSIQVSELNDLAAILMIMQWKRMIGFYASDKSGCIESVLSIAANKILNQYEG